ncbi:hypothetical protein ACFSVM_09660 [Paenibacillus shunpengii]|uniref:Uncharacterized protein n=1 Tax=Paenibacillus shunpengii TaxID=2054424 RepID=A0ABW5SNA8_9BACL|nr:hypothetical protein [Paenibacillus sp. FSL H7-0326]OMC64425.1 hypothetical protein BK126_25205 [Paenibacillus sp. FSL H7-0326]
MKKIFLVFTLGAVLLSGCAKEAEESNSQVSTSEIEQTETATEKEITENKELLSQDETEGIVVNGINKEGDIFSSINVEINGRNKTFNWTNITNPSFYPQIFVGNVDVDKEDEVIIVLTTGEGIGIRESNIHVLKRDFSEIEVTDPLDKLKDVVKWNLKKGDSTRDYSISILGKGKAFIFNESDVVSWFDEPVMGNIIRYGFLDNRIVAEIPIQVSPGTFIGYVIVKFSLDEGKLSPTDYQYQEQRIL